MFGSEQTCIESEHRLADSLTAAREQCLDSRV